MYTWIHINDMSIASVQEILPEATVITDGDCGSVWGEHHPEGIACPFPHVLIRQASGSDVETLKGAGVRFIADRTEDWGEDVLGWRWIEDPDCVERERFSRDYRAPYFAPSH